MQRRSFIQLALAGAANTLVPDAAMAARSGSRNPGGFSVVEADVGQLQQLMARGQLSAQQLVTHYLARIRAIDMAGPTLKAVIELNPEARAIALELDRERKAKGARGPLHGIPVLIKDNIATADKMQTTAGSLALLGAKAPRDAFLVQRLREAGAVILGKTNLSEWANIRSTRSTSGWSARGGLTLNPYALDRNTSGSSSGSAAAAAASLATLAVGTETDGSITSPASLCGLVGIKPTVGLISRDGIVPIAHSQDTAGPLTRTVADAALLLGAMAGRDPRDPATSEGPAKPQGYGLALDPQGLKGARIGVVRNQFGNNPRLNALIEGALQTMRAEEAVLVDVELPYTDKYGDSELEVLLFELKADLNRYLADFGGGAPVRSLKEIIAFNERFSKREMPYFDQELLLRAEAKGGLDDAAYREALLNNWRYSRAEGIDAVMNTHTLEALVAPTSGPAWLTDLVNGDHYGTSFTSPAAVAGYPHITVPAGHLSGLPVGLSFVGRAWSEAGLIRLAYAFEQATHHRRPPEFLRTTRILG